MKYIFRVVEGLLFIGALWLLYDSPAISNATLLAWLFGVVILFMEYQQKEITFYFGDEGSEEE